jgi:DNA-binding transcriptional LysR family regulator
MEEYFGVPLFGRSGRKATLTEAGAILFAAAEEIMVTIDDAERRIDDLKGLRGGKVATVIKFPDRGLHPSGSTGKVSQAIS